MKIPYTRSTIFILDDTSIEANKAYLIYGKMIENYFPELAVQVAEHVIKNLEKLKR